MSCHQWLLAALACAALVTGCKQDTDPVQLQQDATFPQLDGGYGDSPQNPPQQDGPLNPPQQDGPLAQQDGSAPQQDGSSTAKLPGGACQCDSECQAVGTHAGICVFGVCMTRASAACSAAGSTAECGAGSRCWGLTGYTGSICWPDCATYTSCAGECDGDGSCVSTTSMDCDHTCGAYCTVPVNPGTGPGPAPNPLPSCLSSLPARDCTGGTANCSQLITFDPRTNTSWDDYPINGETAGNQYRSYLRRDLVMLIQYATAKVACLASTWTTGVGGALGLGDMSEANGAIPGTSIGSPGHPTGTHTNGLDIDVGYYQTATNNRLREICAHTIGSTEQYHCTAAPTTLDQWRHALFLGVLAESARLRVVGVDGQAGAILEAAIAQLCTDGWMSGASCNDVPLAYEVTDTGMGWFLFHHHHSHVSISNAAYTKAPRPSRCLDAACSVGSRKALPMPRHSLD